MKKEPRSYNQYCALARALDIVGERWTLLIVRELMSGPKRYTDLRDALPGIGTNLLAARLKEMEGNGLVMRGKLPPPAASAIYDLTERGRGLTGAISELIKWGIVLLEQPKDGEHFMPHWAFQALLLTFNAEEAAGISETYEFEIDNEIFHFRINAGEVEGKAGPASDPDMIFSGSSDEFLALGTCKDPKKYVQKMGLLRHGTPEMAERFIRIFRKR